MSSSWCDLLQIFLELHNGLAAAAAIEIGHSFPLTEPGRHHAHDSWMARQHDAGQRVSAHSRELRQETCVFGNHHKANTEQIRTNGLGTFGHWIRSQRIITINFQFTVIRIIIVIGSI